MKVIIMGLDIEEKCKNEIEEQVELYNCEYYHYTDIDELEQVLKVSRCPLVVAIDITNNQKQKFELSAKISRKHNIHILFISKELEPEDRVRWLNLGASGYIKSPFLCKELLHRAVIICSNRISTGELIDDNFHVDFRARKIFYQGNEVKVTPKLFELIIYFMENEGQIVKRSDIMCYVYGANNYLSDRNIDTLIKELRKLTSPNVVKTIRGVGYLYKNPQIFN